MIDTIDSSSNRVHILTGWRSGFRCDRATSSRRGANLVSSKLSAEGYREPWSLEKKFSILINKSSSVDEFLRVFCNRSESYEDSLHIDDFVICMNIFLQSHLRCDLHRRCSDKHVPRPFECHRNDSHRIFWINLVFILILKAFVQNWVKYLVRSREDELVTQS